MNTLKNFIKGQLETTTVNRKLLFVVIVLGVVGNVSILGQIL
ncbi:hypothetical protein [Pseudoalteromonas phage PH357]|nr:hypothetical protein [Pseudoalteromonas phage PH357]